MFEILIMVLNENPRVPNLLDRTNCLEFQQIRRELKAKQARQREQRNATVYRHSGLSVYRAASYSAPNPLDSQVNPTKFEGLQPYESLPVPPTRFHHQPYPTHTTSTRSRYENMGERDYNEVSRNWRDSSPAHIPPGTRWSSDNYHDLHSRHPAVAKDLLSQVGIREATLSPQHIDVAWSEDRYDSMGHGAYIQGPNGPTNTREPYHQYGRKEF